MEAAIASRFADQASLPSPFPPGSAAKLRSPNTLLGAGRQRSVRITARLTAEDTAAAQSATLNRDLTFQSGRPPPIWVELSKEARDEIEAAAAEVLRTADVAPVEIQSNEDTYTITFETEKVTFLIDRSPSTGSASTRAGAMSSSRSSTPRASACCSGLHW